jgi:hypothetical protein
MKSPSNFFFATLNLEETHSSATPARNQQSAWHHIPEDYIFTIKHVRGLLKRN